MKLIKCEQDFYEVPGKTVFNINVLMNKAKVRNPYFGIFYATMIDGSFVKLPSFSNSKYDYRFSPTLFGTECFFTASFDKEAIKNVKEFSFGIRDFGVKWFPETFIIINNHLPSSSIINTESSGPLIITEDEVTEEKVENHDLEQTALSEVVDAVQDKNIDDNTTEFVGEVIYTNSDNSHDISSDQSIEKSLENLEENLDKKINRKKATRNYNKRK